MCACAICLPGVSISSKQTASMHQCRTIEYFWVTSPMTSDTPTSCFLPPWSLMWNLQHRVFEIPGLVFQNSGRDLLQALLFLAKCSTFMLSVKKRLHSSTLQYSVISIWNLTWSNISSKEKRVWEACIDMSVCLYLCDSFCATLANSETHLCHLLWCLGKLRN